MQIPQSTTEKATSDVACLNPLLLNQSVGKLWLWQMNLSYKEMILNILKITLEF